MCKKHFTVVASWGVILTSLNAAKYLNPLVPNLGMGAPPKGQNINLKGLGMINERQKKEKKTTSMTFGTFSVTYLFLWNIGLFDLVGFQTSEMKQERGPK